MAFEDIPVRENGDRIQAPWFNTIRTQGMGSPGWTKFTIDYEDLQTGALTKQLTIFELAIKGLIEGVIIKTKTAFVGTSISSLVLDVGVGGETDKWMADYDLLAAVSASNYQWISVQDILSWSVATNILANATAVGANLSALTAGEVEIWFKKGVLG